VSDYKEPSIKELFDEVMKRLDDIDMKINRISTIPPVYPITPVKLTLGGTTCAKCGMRWEGVMGFVCMQSGCPVQMQVTSQTYNVSYTTGNFDIESLDPAERTWYYDGDGTKRRKE
jgi:hypothetical protein